MKRVQRHRSPSVINSSPKNNLQKSSVGIINLGCARNLTDSQIILGRLKKNGYPIVDIKNAEVAIVNTCSFIKEAKEESIDVILDLIELKKQGKIKKIIVAGCLSQRYPHELIADFKEIDAITGVLSLERDEACPQVILTPKHFAYVKISESCFNPCSFCTIPKIKGKFCSRTIESIVKEVTFLDSKGVKEISIIGQDITAYGMDIYKKKSLSRLLKEIVSVTKNIRWVRLLYAFPAHVDDELIGCIADEKKICRYLDMPLQHISDGILKRMNRHSTKQQTVTLVKKLREKIPDISLRTTFIVGFPGETDENFQELLDFSLQFPFEHVGVFPYSHEEGTAAYDFKDQVPETVKRKRLNLLMRQQQEISRNLQKKFLGKKLEVLIDEKQKGEENIYLGRTQYQAPEVDGLVYVHTKRTLSIGDFVPVEINDTYEYDLVAKAL
ncbi:MAG TPA: 30S ribosomal protein S12 methylthiotransferase RimO [Candidatus Omnitrophota bacterium]|nr:30S ribosomal protein S12 methylthiotransferase RimO [Candidatus Omnitrophota bacterium]HPD85070.1 30S ribosomal protein S12 methylthiotransferase RimO [Candidatus Omnitrophota bacterium]HRZ03928.1 30S ribosomal protein S12 methylthiotransferase RimO [Candidatus Omnitrophota bacterium]